MKKHILLLLMILFMESWLNAECKRSFGGGSRTSYSARRGGSKGSTTTSTSGGWFFSSKTQQKPSAPPAPKPAAPAPGTGYGWVKPAGSTGFAAQAKPAGSTGFVAQSQPKAGFVNPSVAKANQPSSNIGPGGYPVQPGFQAKPPPYPGAAPNAKPAPYPVQPPAYTPNANAKPPQYSAQLPAGHSSYNPTQKVNPPAYSPTNPHSYSAPSYNSPKKVTVNNHYHYSSPSGGSSSFGYPGGHHNGYGGYSPSYNGLGLFSSGRNSYGYPGSGSWGMPSYGSGGGGSMTKGLLIGAAGGYLASSLVNRISNPWGYGGAGYGSGYAHGYRDFMTHQAKISATPAPAIVGPTEAPPQGNDWINCVAFDPSTNTTLINPNCTCSVTVITDPMTGLNQSYHDCTPYGMTTPSPYIRVPAAPQAPNVPDVPTYGVNNPPPSFNGPQYSPGATYGSYGTPIQEGPVQTSIAAAAVTSAVNQDSSITPTTAAPPEGPVTEAQIGHASPVDAKRNEIYSQLEQLVNMGRFKN